MVTEKYFEEYGLNVFSTFLVRPKDAVELTRKKYHSFIVMTCPEPR